MTGLIIFGGFILGFVAKSTINMIERKRMISGGTIEITSGPDGDKWLIKFDSTADLNVNNKKKAVFDIKIITVK